VLWLIAVTFRQHNAQECDPNLVEDDCACDVSNEQCYTRKGTKCVKVVDMKINNCVCTGWEGKTNGKVRQFRITKCDHGIPSAGCIYRGDPHDCRDYNKKQQQFYEELMKDFMLKLCKNDQGKLCPKEALVSNMCKDCDKADFLFMN